MSHKRNHAEVSLGGTGAQVSSSDPSRHLFGEDSTLKFEDPDDVVMDVNKPRRASRSTDEAESDAGSDPTSRSRKKAEPVKSACVQCQKRKTKCSGQRPVCRFCSDRNLECSWDISDGLTRTADLKRKLQQANGRSDDLAELVGAMRHGTDQTSTMLLARLRLGDTLAELLTNIRLNEYSGKENNPMSSQMTESNEPPLVHTSTENASPTNQHHQFDWRQSDFPFNRIPPGGDWKPNLSPNFYEASSQQQQPPYFTTPDFDQSRMTWRRSDSYHATDGNTEYGSGTQQQHDSMPSQSVRASPRDTRATRGSISDPTGHNENRPSSSRKTNS